MSKVTILFVVAGAMLLPAAESRAGGIDGQGDNQRDDLGYYYAMTGGKFPTGTTPNGEGISGGTFRFLFDDPAWYGNYAASWQASHPLGQWHKDGWFPENASLALTLKNGAAIVYDNNGIEDNSYGDYYDATGLASSNSKPGLYRGYSMSNNYDWIYAGYFKVEAATTVDTIIGYYDENAGFDSNSPLIEYDMNIWSAVQDDPVGNPNSWMPVVNSFTGDIFSAKSTAGSFSWSDTGVDRIFGDDSGNVHDDIHRLVFELDSPLTLQPGVYFFSHDAEISTVPVPGTGLAGMGLIGLIAAKRRSHSHH